MVVCLSFTAKAQVKFDSEDPLWMQNNGLAEVTIYESYKDALKAKNTAYKLSSVNEMINSRNALKLGKLTQLQLLNLINNGLTLIPKEWATMRNLFILVSKKNALTYLDPGFIASANLLYMELHGTKLDSLPREIEQMGRLELLRIIGNESDTLRISDSISRITSLREIMIADANLYNFPSFITRSKKVESISLINCKIDSIPEEAQWMENVKYLNLEGNNLKSVPLHVIRRLKNLEVLILRNNKISEFSEFICYMPKLELIDISGNQMSLSDLDILRVIFKRRGVIISDYEKLLKERIGEQKLK